jgi:hypothetical protein
MESSLLQQDKMILKNKKGVSILIGYVLLIVIVLSGSVVIYQYMKSFVPQNEAECDVDVNLIVRSYTCDAISKTLVLTIQNKGLFNVPAMNLRASDVEGGELATKVLGLNGSFSSDCNIPISARPEYNILSSAGSGFLKPGREANCKYNYGSVFPSSDIKFIEITPFIIKDDNPIICPNSGIKEIIICS